MARVEMPETRKFVLSVNDSSDMDQGMYDWFRSRGVVLVRARSTPKAMELLGRCDFDAVVTNLRRTENGIQGNHAGIELARLIRLQHKSFPIFIYTANVDAATQQLALKSGVTAVAVLPGELQKELIRHGL